MAAKKKWAMTKEGSKKNRRVYSKGTDSVGAEKNENGKGKETGSRKKQKRDEDDYEDEEVEDGEIEMENSWRSFVTRRMMKIDIAFESLAREMRS